MDKVGITEIGVAVPSHYISIASLAEAREMDPERATVGLGLLQGRIPFDTSVSELAARAIRKIRHRDVERFYFATESDSNLAKPTIAVRALSQAGLGPEVLPVQTKFACLAGVQNLVSACESVALRQEPAIIVMADRSVYRDADPLAEVTGGCGAVALRIEPSPRIEVSFRKIGVHVEDIDDFHVPFHTFPFPVIDGRLSTVAYCHCVKGAFDDWRRKNGYVQGLSRLPFEEFHFIAHTPFPKMVEWAMATLWGEGEHLTVSSYRRNPALLKQERGRLKQIRRNPRFREFYEDRVNPYLKYSPYVGNSYTAAAFVALIAAAEKGPRRIILVGYGSGAGSVALKIDILESIRTDLDKQIQEGEKISLDQYEEWKRSICS